MILYNKISVIIPVFNVEKYIGRCLDSILANGYSNLEIICVNDGSTDNGLNVLLNYANKDNRIIVISTCNGGVSRARNIGLEICTGEYVAFIDPDDCIHNQYFSILYGVLKNRSVSAVLCKWEMFSDDYKTSPIDIPKLDNKQYTMRELLKTEYVQNCWARLYKRSIISDIGFDEKLIMGEDGAFNREVMWNNRDKSAAVIDYPLYYYFQRMSSVTHKYDFFFNRRGTISFYIQKTEESTKTVDKEYWMSTAFEFALGYRYNAFSKKRIEDIKIAKGYLKCCIKIMIKNKLFSFKTRIRYLILYASPKYYKMFNKLV